jgi:hypothetical protein
MALRHAPLLLALAAPVLLCGCMAVPSRASRPQSLHLTYVSDPPGAMLYEGTKAWGRAPITLVYPGSVPQFGTGTCFTPNPVRMRWVSGAEVSVSDVTACPRNGTQQQYVLERPKGVPGLEDDVRFAAAYEQAEATRAAAAVQAQAANDAASLQAFAILNSEKPAPSGQAPPSNVHCTSRTVGQGQYAHTETDCN